jgi:DNA-binding NtrC family response regulator
MNEVLRVLSTGGDEKEALRRSFEHASEGFGAEKALFLLIVRPEPLELRSLCVRGLDRAEIEACERGLSVAGVSSSLIRSVVAGRRLKVLRNSLPRLDQDATPALAGESYSVLCAPVLDPIRDVVLAVMYFQSHAREGAGAYDETDAVWLEGYASALGRTFALHFQEQRRQQELEELLKGSERPEGAPELIGESAHTQALRRALHETYIPAAEYPDPEPLLILGEKGTGKDVVARYIHAYSARRDRPFVVVNCAEITDELAAARFFGHKKGSFTGAIADEQNRTVMPVGETREVRVDVQVILATNRDPERAVAEGLLKADFLDRFRTQAIQLQPLRERPWDIPDLARHFLAHHERRTRKRTLGLMPDALRAMLSYAWPGNVRELARVCSLLVTHARAGAPVDRDLLAASYPALLKAARNPKAAPILGEDVAIREAVRAFERELILGRLERHQGDVRAARLSLGLPKTTFHRYLAKLGISVDHEADDSEP